MAAVLARSSHSSSVTNPSNSNPERKPVKKSSFLSLRREKRLHSSPTDTVRSSSPAERATPPSAYFAYEQVSRPSTSHSLGLRERVQAQKPRSIVSVQIEERFRVSKGKERSPTEPQQRSPTDDGPYCFPSVEDQWTTAVSREEATSTTRIRSRTSPSHRQDWERRPVLNYPYGDSGSTLSQYETPPHTPVDDLSFRDPIFSLPVMVAAPVSGVETMDALVDGMNGFGSGDDQFMGIAARSRLGKSGFHPLYHPPLPTPPPGVTLGGGLPRKSPARHREEGSLENIKKRSRREQEHRRHRTVSSRHGSTTTVTPDSIPSNASLSDDNDSISNLSIDPSLVDVDRITPNAPRPKSVAPSISEIIRAHAPQQTRPNSVAGSLAPSRRTSYSHSQDHSTYQGSIFQEAHYPLVEDDADLVSRSSVDTIAEEVRQTIRNQIMSSAQPLHHSRSFQQLSSANVYARSLHSPRSDSRRDSSLYAHSVSTLPDQNKLPLELLTLPKSSIGSPSQAIAQYLRSSRLTTLLTLTRSPHASGDSPLTVSLSDLGSSTGSPLVVFLGLGCVRHIMGLYDEMAELLGIRLITIDRWGLGRTDAPRFKSAKGIPEWASVVEEVLDLLHIDQCSIMAHSAGAPYALAFANRCSDRIRGDICLLAPWVGGGEAGGYKWLKYVPNGILKTAQAAEWKVQAWMLGKPPTIAYEGIGFDVRSLPAHQLPRTPTSPQSFSLNNTSAITSSTDETLPRPSIASNFSDYDDLRDFDGRFESRSTLGKKSTESRRSRKDNENNPTPVSNRKSSKGFLGRLKGGTNSQSNSPHASPSSGKTLKALRSMGSLKGKSSNTPVKKISAPTPPTPSLPQPPQEVGLGLDNVDWIKSTRTTSPTSPKSLSTPPSTHSRQSDGIAFPKLSCDSRDSYPRSGGRRSISVGASKYPVPPVPSLPPSPLPETAGSSYQAALGNALIAASHSESSKGAHGDLVQILNHDHQPWGFSYTTYPHRVRVWYGDRDEKIAENAVRWMETTMGPNKCRVNVVKGADHALMYKSGVVIDVLETVGEFWKDD